jgi:hypothetical protein
MWKRETKLGLVVSGSFLCLLGTVVAKKLIYPDAVPEPVAENNVAQGPATLKTPPDKDAAAGNTSEPKKHTLRPGQASDLLPAALSTSTPPSGGAADPPSGGSASAAVSPSALPPTLPKVTVTDIPAGPPNGENHSTDDELKKQTEKARLGSYAKKPNQSNDETAGGSLPGSSSVAPGTSVSAPTAPAAVVMGQSPAPPGAAADKGQTPSAPGGSSTALPGSPPDKGKPGTAESTLPAAPPATDSKPTLPGAPPGTTSSTTPVTPPVAVPIGTDKKTETISSIPPADSVIPPKPPAPPSSSSDSVKPVAPATAIQKPNTDVAAPPSPPTVAPIQVGEPAKTLTPTVPIKIVGDEPEHQSQPTSKQPGSTNIKGPSPVPVVTVPDNPSSGSVKVTDYFTELYRCQPGKLTFADISLLKYNSTNFADALLQFNRDLPDATASIRQNPPQLKVDDIVRIPPTYVLKAKYGALIKNDPQPTVASKPPVVAKTPDPAAVSPYSTPPNAAPGTGNTTPPTAGIPIKMSEPQPLNLIQQTANGPVYLVKGDKEMIIEIAQKTGFHWSEIYRLNPTINPSYPLTQGTQLALPTTTIKGN